MCQLDTFSFIPFIFRDYYWLLYRLNDSLHTEKILLRTINQVLLSGHVTKQASIYSPGAPLRLSMSWDVLLSAQAPEISAADRSDNIIMRYDLYAESDGSRSLLRSSFATYVMLCIYIFFNSQELLMSSRLRQIKQ